MNGLAVAAERSIGMSVIMSLGRLVAYAFPLAFVVCSWLAGAGLPYYLDSNETFLSYVHARNLEIWNPWEYAWLTAEATDPQRPTTENFYTHQPNAARYFHYVLLRVGVRELPAQVLVLSLLATGLTVMLLWRVFAHPALAVVPLAVVLDYTGFLSWTVNTYRIWMFVLFFGLVLAVQRNRPFWFGLLSFFVIQLDFGIAAFVGATTIMLSLLTHGRHARPSILASGVGAVLSLGIFGIQVLAFYGWDGFVHELAVTYARRGTAGAAMQPGTFAFQAWHGLARLAGEIAYITYNRAVLVAVIAGIMIALRTLVRGDETGRRLFLARLTLASLAGAIATSTLLYGYFTDAFVNSKLPLAVFLIAPSVGVVALELDYLLSFRWTSPHRTTLCMAMALLPIVVSSATHYQPPIAVDVFRLLQREYRGRTIVAPSPAPWMAGPHLAFALTGGRAVPSWGFDVPPEQLEHLEPLRDADGTLTYVCVDTLYLREIALRPEFVRLYASHCDQAVARMASQGHPVVAGGVGWWVMRLNREASFAEHTEDGLASGALPSPVNTVGTVSPGRSDAVIRSVDPPSWQRSEAPD
jgi:hypothetical protein